MTNKKKGPLTSLAAPLNCCIEDAMAYLLIFEAVSRRLDIWFIIKEPEVGF